MDRKRPPTINFTKELVKDVLDFLRAYHLYKSIFEFIKLTQERNFQLAFLDIVREQLVDDPAAVILAEMILEEDE